MIKRESLQNGSKYSNAKGEIAFVGSRIEGQNRVSTLQFEVPYTPTQSTCECPIGGSYAKITVKVSVPSKALPAEYETALTKAVAYVDSEILTIADYKSLAAGAIEWTVEDIV